MHFGLLPQTLSKTLWQPNHLLPNSFSMVKDGGSVSVSQLILLFHAKFLRSYLHRRIGWAPNFGISVACSYAWLFRGITQHRWSNSVGPYRIFVDFVCRQGVIFLYKSYIRLNFEVSRQIADYCCLQLIVLVRVFVHFVLRLFVGQSRLSSPV